MNLTRNLHAKLSVCVMAGAMLVSGAVVTSASDLDTFNAKAEAIFKEASAPQTARPPATGPLAAKGKSIAIIPAAMAAEGLSRVALGAQEAAKTLGWNTTLIDAAGDPTKMSDAVLKAINLKVDGIILCGVDAKAIQGSLQQAKQAGIKLVAQGENSADTYDSVLPANSDEFFYNQGYVVAASAYVLGDKKLRMIQLRDDEFASVFARAEGSNTFIKDCKAAGGDCELLATANTLVADLTTVVPKQAVSLALLHPDYNVLWTGYDGALYFVIQQGLQQADLLKSGFAVGFDANAANVNIIRDGGYERGSLTIPLEWLGYGLADNLNRLFANEPTVDQGMNSRLLTKENLPAEGIWAGDHDFRSSYKTIWGVQ